MPLMTELARYLRDSRAARAVFGLLTRLARCRCGGLSAGQLAWLLVGRFRPRTVFGAVIGLRRLGALQRSGRSRSGARVWVAVMEQRGFAGR